MGDNMIISFPKLRVHVHTLVKKRNSSPFHLQILKLPDGVQASNGTLAIPVLPLVVSKFANEKARSFFFE